MPPSPVYLLLTNLGPNHHLYSQVLQILQDGEWVFDPNETHDGKSLLTALVKNWQVVGSDQGQLAPLVAALLKRGANPVPALVDTTHAPWWTRQPTAHALLQAHANSSVHASEAELEMRLRQVVSIEGKATVLAQRVESILSDNQGWETHMGGVRVAPWLAVYASDLGEYLAGWRPERHLTSQDRCATRRLLFRLVLQARKAVQHTPLEHWLLATGMMALGMRTSSSLEEEEASKRLRLGAQKIIERIDVPEVLAQLVHPGSCVSPSVQSRAIGAWIRTLSRDYTWTDSALSSNQVVWKSLAVLAPHIEKSAADVSEIAAILHHAQAPSTQFWQGLSPTQGNQQAIVDLLVLSNRRIGQAKSPERVKLAEGFLAWMQKNQLPALSQTQFQALEKGLEEDVETLTLLRAQALNQETVPATGLRPSARI